MRIVWSLVAVIVVWFLLRIWRSRRDVHGLAARGELDRLRQLVGEDRARIVATNAEGETPLHLAAAHGQLEVTRFLLQEGADVNLRASRDVTPLHFAAAFGRRDVVALLIERGAEVDARDDTGMTPLIAAQTREHAEVVELLRAAGADPDVRPAVGDLDDGHFVSAIDDDDPLLVAATAKAQATIDLLLLLFADRPDHTMVKFAFQSNGGSTEHLWAHLLQIEGNTLRVRVETLPLRHDGEFDPMREIDLRDVEDWQVEQADGRLRGGYGFQVVFHRAREQLGQLPAGMAKMEPRFVDHDIEALRAEAGA